MQSKLPLSRWQPPCSSCRTALSSPPASQPNAHRSQPAAWREDNFDPVYNVCRGTDPRCYHPGSLIA